MRVLVISSYFGPETSVGVLRVNAFVKYWARAGHEIHVITMPFSGNLPDGFEKNVCVFQVAPYLIGSRQSGDVQGYAKGASGIKKRIVDFQYWLKRRFLSNYLDPRILWWPKVARFVREELLPENRYEVIFSTVPSYTAHSAAASCLSTPLGSPRWPPACCAKRAFPCCPGCQQACSGACVQGGQRSVHRETRRFPCASGHHAQGFTTVCR